MRGAVLLFVGLCVWFSVLLYAGTADAYDFEVDANTTVQWYSLSSFRFTSNDVVLDRRRLSQTLSLNIWDLGGKQDTVHRLRSGNPKSGPDMRLTSMMRLDHDFGAFARGTLSLSGREWDALDVIPELQTSTINLQVLSLEFAATNLAGGLLDIYIGRQLFVGGMQWRNVDGVRAKVHTTAGFSLEASAGFLVRDSSFLGSEVSELDGTSSAECQEYVEGALSGSGSWRPIDRDIPIVNRRFVSDYEICPQRDQAMPTFSVGIQTKDTGALQARAAYVRTMSSPFGLIGAPDRLEFPDTGLYPNEEGQLAKWSVNEEYIDANVSAHKQWGNVKTRLFAGSQFSLLHQDLTQAHLRISGKWKKSDLRAEAYRLVPTFDSDSIFSVFSSQPYTDYRIRYGLRWGRLDTYAQGWFRKHSVTQDGVDQPESTSVGGKAGVRFVSSRVSNRNGKVALWQPSWKVDTFWDDGYGGKRMGAIASMVWPVAVDWQVDWQVNAIHLANSSQTFTARRTGAGTVLGITHWLSEGLVAKANIEMNKSTGRAWQTRALAALELRFAPEH